MLTARPRPKQDMTELWAKVSGEDEDIKAMDAAAAQPELLLLSDWSRFTSDETWSANEASKLLVL